MSKRELSKEEAAAKKNLKEMNTREKLSYFWFYYKIHTIVAIIAIALLSSFIYEIVTKKDSVLNVMCLNSAVMLTETELEQIEDEFLEMHNLEKEKYTLSLDTGNFVNLETLDQMSGAVIQKLMSSVAANTLDIILADKTMADYCASGNTYYTIEELLTPAQLDRLEANITTLDYTDPDTLKTFHFAIALNITDAPKIKEWNLYPDIDGYLMVPLGAKNIEYVKSFIDYIYEY